MNGGGGVEKEERGGGRGGDGGVATGAPCGSSRERVCVCVCALRHKGRFRQQDTQRFYLTGFWGATTGEFGVCSPPTPTPDLQSAST